MGWKGTWVDGLMGEWTDGWVDGWKDGWVLQKIFKDFPALMNALGF